MKTLRRKRVENREDAYEIMVEDNLRVSPLRHLTTLSVIGIARVRWGIKSLVSSFRSQIDIMNLTFIENVVISSRFK